MRHFLAIGLSVCAAIAISPAYAASPSGAPLPPTDVHVTFPYGALEGYVEFTAPQKTVAGDEITANLSYTITAWGSIRFWSAWPMMPEAATL